MTTFHENQKTAVICGAGPAGLTAALELLRTSNIRPIVFEVDDQVGGISKTFNFRGNRMDLGGHRFFSKSDWVMRWWQDVLPLDGSIATHGALHIAYQQQTRDFVRHSPRPTSPDAVLLLRPRLSRIYYRRRYFDYPLTLNFATLRSLGMIEALRIGLSYGKAQLLRRPHEKSLEDFFINRFGERLYRTFFKDYTEKVWGVACADISAEWGTQRIKGLSVSKALADAVARLLGQSRRAGRAVETSLIEQFLYPKLGPGQMWEEVEKRVKALGAEVNLRHRVTGVSRRGTHITGVEVRDTASGTTRHVECDYVVSTMPVQELVPMLKPANAEIESIARRLPYRDFISVGLLLRRMRGGVTPPDNWIYIQEPDVHIGRLQIFNNWSPALVANPETVWLGLEYFCNESDALWQMPDDEFLKMAAGELDKIGIIDQCDVLDGTVHRVPKAYPAYFGSYEEFGVLREHLDTYDNLYPVGRNGMHRYNNQDHSMLTAKAAVECITSGAAKASIWDVNAEESYHEDSVRHETLDRAVARS